MKWTYNKSRDTAYLSLNHVNGKEDVIARTYPCDPLEVQGHIHLDFDGEGTLVGITILAASSMLKKEILDQAELI